MKISNIFLLIILLLMPSLSLLIAAGPSELIKLIEALEAAEQKLRIEKSGEAGRAVKTAQEALRNYHRRGPRTTPRRLSVRGGVRLGVAAILGYVGGCEWLFYRYFSAMSEIDGLCQQLFECRLRNQSVPAGGLRVCRETPIRNAIADAQARAAAQRSTFDSVCLTPGYNLPEVPRCEF